MCVYVYLSLYINIYIYIYIYIYMYIYIYIYIFKIKNHSLKKRGALIWKKSLAFFRKLTVSVNWSDKINASVIL